MTGNFLIRPAAVADRSALEALQTRASLANPGDRDALLAHPDAIELPAAQIAAGGVFVSEQAGAIAGFAAILPRGDGDADLDALFVEPASWRRGVGRALVRHCGEAARAAGSSTLHVVGNPHAKQFYLACGFQISGIAETRFGTGLLLKKPL